MRKAKKRNTILYKFLISYILILGIAMVFYLAIYSRTVTILEDATKKSNLSMLEQSRDIIDRHIQELDSMIERVAMDPRIISIANMDKLKEGSPDIDLLINALNNLSAYRLTNNFIKDFYIYFKSSDVIMTASRANTNMKLLYGNYFKFGDLSYEEWVSKTAGRVQVKSYLPSTKVTFNGREYPVITRLQSIPLEYPKSNKGCIIAFIDTKAVQQLLQKINTGNDGYSYIIDENNSVIAAADTKGEPVKLLDIPFNKQSGVTNTKVSGKSMFVSYTISNVNQWKYIAAIPTAFVMTEVNNMRTIVISALLVMLVVGIVLSWVFSYKNAKPIKEISESLKEFLGDTNSYKNEYSFLSGSIYNLISKNKNLGEKLNEQLPMIKAAFLRRLLHGNYRDVEEIYSNMAHLDICIRGEAYVVGIIKISGYRGLINKNILRELDLSRLIINRTIQEKSYGRAVSCDLNETGIALLLFSDLTDLGKVKTEFESVAKEIYGALQSELQIFTAFALGSIYTSLLDIGYSFNEARHTLDHITINQEDRLVWYGQITKQNISYKYSIDIEQNLIGLVKSGDVDELGKLLRSIQNENFSKRKLTVPLLKLLQNQLIGTLIRMTENLGLEPDENKLVDILLIEDADYAFEEICKCFRELADAVNMKKDRSDDLLYGKVLNYINEAYKNGDLTLYSIAVHFNVTETYLYHFFKEKTGVTFASHLEKLRMERAYALITETVYPISEIAFKVGYGSVHSFRRAFKRCMGSIPSDLRET